MLRLLVAESALGRLYLEFVYIGLVVAGLVGLGFSLLFGDHDTDHDTDHDADHDSDHDSGGHGNMSMLSIKVLWCFLVGGGVGGYFGALNGLGNLGSMITAGIAGAVIASMGYGVINTFYRGQSSSTVRTASLVGRSGVVETAISATGTGRAMISLDSGSTLMLAESEHRVALPEGASITVVAVNGSTVRVVAHTASDGNAIKPSNQ
ncbi:MAG: NfeD family protein [Candidatus Pacebacteria bacterium]|nr:NfeD family protein [Candidatus Paceibacterota bacterium]